MRVSGIVFVAFLLVMMFIAYQPVFAQKALTKADGVANPRFGPDTRGFICGDRLCSETLKAPIPETKCDSGYKLDEDSQQCVKMPVPEAVVQVPEDPEDKAIASYFEIKDPTNPDNIPSDADFLFIQVAESGSFIKTKDGYTLTLFDVAPQIVYFADRPYRITGHMTAMDWAFGIWKDKKVNFEGDAPNAVLTIFDTDKESDEISMVLSNAKYVADENTMQYDVTILGNYFEELDNQERQKDTSIPEKFGVSSLFIDGSQDCADLLDADLRGCSFSGAQLAGAVMDNSNLSGVDLSGANMQRALLINANLQGANLNDVNLSGASMTLANLAGATIFDANLSGADLSNTNLKGVSMPSTDLSNANLAGANMEGTNLTEVNFSGANLSGADLTSAQLSGAELGGANLSGASLVYTVLNGLDMSHSSMPNANLSNTAWYFVTLSHSNLSGANLQGTSMSRCIMEGVNLSGADLSGGDFGDSNLFGADLSKTKIGGIYIETIDREVYGTFTGANMSGANLSGATADMAVFENAHLSGADLTGASLRGATFEGSDLSNAKMSNADLTGAILVDANLSGADLTGANLVAADLRGANLNGAILKCSNNEVCDK
ncbi:pentapeptide repeat-containing protein [Candidatus Nitrosotenuis cloacae]|uniref:pentapeptide repeat-containing protein n=1 Tax=Candidatus Nitrosotenuis cloacae TaxID=1603555 RepID=UPI00227EDAD9|nr:pentapeptide repeat-containing protein [Candidatus Nitrosotenuis cloacae]